MLAAALLACFHHAARAAPPARRALLIGIDDYSASKLRGTPPAVERDWRNLNGAVNDVKAMKAMLIEGYRFNERDIVLLPNQEATREAILRAITTQLIQPTKKGDIALFYFAGHGAQVPNSLSTEDDKRDESLVPADSRVGGRDIRDKELHRLFNRVLDRGAHLTVILDNCNSASGTRGLLTGGRIRALKPEARDAADRASEGLPPEDRGALVIAAAQDYETARETFIEGMTDRGVFSWALVRAMRVALAMDDDEPAIDTFLRAQAILRGEAADQQPVISGTDEARRTPLFEIGARSKKHEVFVIEKARSDGTAVLQGGWARGLTVGSQLRAAGRDDGTRLTVTAMRGLDRADARVTARGGMAIAAGDVLEIVAWAAPPIRPLRVSMPRTADYGAAVDWTRTLARLAARKNIRWINDPTEDTPTHQIRVRAGAWELLTSSGSVERLGSPTPATALARIPSGSSLFVQLPVPASLRKEIDVGPGTGRDAIEPVTRPEHADFVLTGRLVDGKVSFTWVRPFAPSNSTSVLPQRTAWKPADHALALRSAVIRLRRIQAWQMLEGPLDAAFAYSLSVRRSRDHAALRDGILAGGEAYDLVLRARGSGHADQRFVYAFMIDRKGRGVLLYPTHGSVENRFPPRPGSATPAEITLEGSFEVVEPYGTDTYFILTTDEPLSDPWILEWDGVRARPVAASPLEELLLGTGGLQRSAPPVPIPSRWSVERLALQSRAESP